MPEAIRTRACGVACKRNGNGNKTKIEQKKTGTETETEREYKAALGDTGTSGCTVEWKIDRR